MPEFKVGDVVTGVGRSSYSITTKHAIMVVLSAGARGIKVEVIEHKDEMYVGETYDVSAVYFKKVEGFKHARIKAIKKAAKKFKAKVGTTIHPSRFYPRGKWSDSMDILKPCITKPKGTADFIILNADGTVDEHLGSACHAPLSYSRHNLPMYVVTAVRAGMPNGKELVDWLINRSPYAEHIINKTVADVFDRGLIIRTNIPSNLLAQALIITRQLWEYEYIVKTWLALSKGGINETIAFAFAHLVTEDGGYKCQVTGGGHNSMSGSYMNKEFFKNYLAGTPKNPNEDYISNSSYRGIHTLWSSDHEHLYGDAVSKLVIHDKMLKGYEETKVKSWGGQIIRKQRIPEDVLIKQLKKLSDNLMKEYGHGK